LKPVLFGLLPAHHNELSHVLRTFFFFFFIFIFISIYPLASLSYVTFFFAVFRKLISFQPSQLGRTNMHYSKLPRTAVETEFKQNVGPPPKDLTTEVYFPSNLDQIFLVSVFYSQYFKHPICVGEYGPKNGAERQIEEQKVLPTTMMFSRLADCALKSTQIPILGVAV
ncbi:uncharacterized protein C5orf64, partial [Papio anubis]|uniref:uncharacterized protein C5orf64 n=1 Tax=Papio anubis TaxID=9555 RepID=UPI0012AE1852